MGRGSSKASNKAGGFSTNTVPNGSGGTIQLDSPLVYGEKDAAINARDRKTLEDWEAKKVKAKIENGLTLDEDGNILEQKRGGKGSVRMATSWKASILTHNHPRENDDTLGGTFSDADLQGFAFFDSMKTKRATAKEGTYSISKTGNFDQKGFMKFSKSLENTGYKDYKSAANGFAKEFRNGSLSYDEYLSKNAKAFNNFLVWSHNQLLDNQQKYGYTYTLEKT